MSDFTLGYVVHFGLFFSQLFRQRFNCQILRWVIRSLFSFYFSFVEPHAFWNVRFYSGFLRLYFRSMFFCEATCFFWNVRFYAGLLRSLFSFYFSFVGPHAFSNVRFYAGLLSFRFRSIFLVKQHTFKCQILHWVISLLISFNFEPIVRTTLYMSDFTLGYVAHFVLLLLLASYCTFNVNYCFNVFNADREMCISFFFSMWIVCLCMCVWLKSWNCCKSDNIWEKLKQKKGFFLKNFNASFHGK